MVAMVMMVVVMMVMMVGVVMMVAMVMMVVVMMVMGDRSRRVIGHFSAMSCFRSIVHLVAFVLQPHSFADVPVKSRVDRPVVEPLLLPLQSLLLSVSFSSFLFEILIH